MANREQKSGFNRYVFTPVSLVILGFLATSTVLSITKQSRDEIVEMGMKGELAELGTIPLLDADGEPLILDAYLPNMEGGAQRVSTIPALDYGKLTPEVSLGNNGVDDYTTEERLNTTAVVAVTASSTVLQPCDTDPDRDCEYPKEVNATFANKITAVCAGDQQGNETDATAAVGGAVQRSLEETLGANISFSPAYVPHKLVVNPAFGDVICTVRGEG
jgi:hypothetical protein